MSNTIIRPVEATDAAQFNAYRHRIADEPDNMVSLSAGEYTRNVDQEYARILTVIENPDQHTLVAESVEGTIIGSCACRGVDSPPLKHVVVLGIDIDQSHRGQGLGNALMSEMIGWAREHPVICRVELTVFAHNRRAISLYIKHGFVIEGLKQRAYYKYGKFVDAYLMALLLD